MSVDYYACDNCGDTFPDCGTYVSCECGRNWCCDECAEDQGYQGASCKLNYDCDDNECEIECWKCENQIESSCSFCRKEIFDDVELLDYALHLLALTRDELMDKYKNT